MVIAIFPFSGFVSGWFHGVYLVDSRAQHAARCLLGRATQAMINPCSSKGVAMESILEMRFHHIVERLLSTWGTPAKFNDMFSDLVFDMRSDRTGWPADAWDELQFLQQLHKQAYEIKPVGHVEEVDDRVKWV